MKRLLPLTIWLPVSFLLLLTACKHEERASTVHIVTGDFFFKPETIELKAGREVKIELVNDGNIEHEFMVGRGVKTAEDEAHEETDEAGEHESSETGHEHHHEHDGGMSSAHAGASRGFDKDFFEGIDVKAETGNGAEFMRMPGHGTMVLLKPHSKATITFMVPTDRIGKWEMACFIPGHYEAKMKGNVTVE
ncbi:MAG: cupredoxin domain-containing protein [Thermodesulfobacteriota bacterium]